MNTKRQLATYRHCRLSCWHQRCSFLCTDCIYQNQLQAWWSLPGTVGKSRSQGPAPCPGHSRLQHTQCLLSSTHTRIEGSRPTPQDTAKHATSNELHTHNTYWAPHTHTEGSGPTPQDTATHAKPNELHMHWRFLARVTVDYKTHNTYWAPHIHTEGSWPTPQLDRILQHMHHLMSSTHTEGSWPTPQDTATHATPTELHTHWRLQAHSTARILQ